VCDVKESRINLFHNEIYQNNQSIIEVKTFLKREGQYKQTEQRMLFEIAVARV